MVFIWRPSWLLGVAELHRWHHKRDYEDAEVNFGEVWMIWDHLFGSFMTRRKLPAPASLGSSMNASRMAI
ncbi:sterol desaturase family protein [Oceanococcus atlanticus]